MKSAFVWSWPLLCLCLLTNVAQARKFPEFPSPSFMHQVIVADNIEFNGMPMRLVEFSAEGGRQRVIEFYRSEWRGEVAEIELDEDYILSHRVGDYLLTVQISGAQGLQTTGTLATSPLFDRSVRPPSDLGKGFPMLPRTEVINDIRAVDGPKVSRTLLLKSTHNLQQTFDFYQRRFEQEGWRAPAPSSGATPADQNEGRALILNRKGDEMNLAFVPDGLATMVVAVLVTRR